MPGDIHALLKELANRRPLFHSEADFQHAFAWLIHEKFPDARIRLEYPREVDNRRIYIDIWAEINDMRHVIELKYNTREFQSEISGELYRLKNQSAQDIGRYSFLDDVQRLEKLASANTNVTAYAIMLTNDGQYWSKSANTATIDAAFRLHENRRITGELRWADHASPGTIKGIEKPITLEGSYVITWQSYSTVSEGSAGQFRYIALEIG